MRRITKMIITALLAVALALPILPAHAAQPDINAVIGDVAAALQRTVTSPGVGQTGGDWTIVALRRAEAEVPDEYYQLYYDNARAYIAKCSGVLSATKHSEYSRVALAFTVLGVDLKSVGGYDLYSPLLDSELAVKQGVNGPVFALIALAATGNAEHEICDWYIDYILSKRLDDGGFALSGKISDPDTTAVAITALSAYSEREDVAEAIETGINRLSRLQRDTGGFTSYSTITSESVSQVIVMLSTLGISIDDARFVKNGNTLLDNLMEYYIPGEGFAHELGGGVDLMATDQAMCALVALSRAQEGRPALYDMTDVTPALISTAQTGLSGKHPDISVPGTPGGTADFADISGLDEETAIYALTRRGIVKGYPGGGFGPEGLLTRAEFAAIIVRALGLPDKTGDGAEFSDVAPGAWYHGTVYTAASYGIIEGRGGGLFDPDGTVTRQEAAVMIARAARLCGMDGEYNDDSARSVLSQFADYRQIAVWAAESMAFCYDNNLLDQSDIDSRPGDNLLRREMAELTYRMLIAARLIERGE